MNSPQRPQVSVQLTPTLYSLLELVAEATEIPKSELCRTYVQNGLYAQIENLNKVEVWKKLVKNAQAD